MLIEMSSEHELDFQNKTIEKQSVDISNLRSNLTEAIQENTELYDFSAALLLTIDYHFIIQRVNFQAAIFIGYERQQLTHELFSDFITFDSKKIFHKTMQTLLDQKIKQTCEIELLQKGGKKQHVIVESTLLRNNLIRLCLIDITHTQYLLGQIFELEKSLSLVNNLLQYSTDAIASLDNELTVNVLNRSFSALFSSIFSVKIEMGTNIGMVLSDFPDIKEKITSACHYATIGEHASVLLENHQDDAVAYYCYEMDINCFYNQHLKKSAFILRIRSLTEYKLEDKKQHKKQADLALACRTSTMGEMASAFAHEINQPLTALIAYSRSCLYIINDKSNDKTTCQSLLLPLEQMALQAEHAGSIIHNMKNIMQDGNFPVETTNINTLIQETLSILKYELQDVKFKISLDLMENPPEIMTNRIHIMQIILNLARNSMEAMRSVSEAKPELLIETRELNGHIAVHVIDNGPGIPVEFKDSILNTYFTTKAQGTGIGLGVCRSLIEAHGGKLSVHQHTKKGAWFTFTLPLSYP